MATTIRQSIFPEEFEGRAAVITGGAKGIGLAAAKRLAGLGMKLCLADNDAAALEKAKGELSPLVSDEGSLRLEVVDVSSFDEVDRLREVAYEAFGEVALLMNNAGVGGPRMKPWDGPDKWSRILDVNFRGMMHGVQVFTEAMVAQNRPSAIVNVGSKEGITTPPGNVAYSVAKAGVKVLTEQLAHELRQIEGCQTSAHLLIPGWTFTSINSSGPTVDEADKPDGAWTADQVAQFMLDGLARGDFYILCPDNSVSRETDEKRIEWAAGDLIENRPALSRWHPEYEGDFARFMTD